MSETFRCYLVSKEEGGQPSAEVTQRSLEELPEGDVLIKVECSSLNFKDALAATGHPGVVKRFPHVPGIDAAGKVAHSHSAAFRTGHDVLVTGFDLGAGHWGGYAEYVRVPDQWVLTRPASLTARHSMIFGTAGFTAALSVEALQKHGIGPESGEIVVTGASGGVGSLAVAILAKAGYTVVASTGKEQAHDWLRELGAAEILSREDLDDTSDRPLLSARWAGAVDTVGGNTLATVLRSTRPYGCVTCCGLVGGTDLPITVYPFILRGLSLTGIDSATYPAERRGAIWEKLAGPWRPDHLDALVADTVSLDGLDDKVQQILHGQIRGRVLVEPR